MLWNEKCRSKVIVFYLRLFHHQYKEIYIHFSSLIEPQKRRKYDQSKFPKISIHMTQNRQIVKEMSIFSPEKRARSNWGRKVRREGWTDLVNQLRTVIEVPKLNVFKSQAQVLADAIEFVTDLKKVNKTAATTSTGTQIDEQLTPVYSTTANSRFNQEQLTTFNDIDTFVQSQNQMIQTTALFDEEETELFHEFANILKTDPMANQIFQQSIDLLNEQQNST